MSFFSRLEDRALQADSLLCVGLDPHAPDLPAPTAEAARDFCLRLVEATSEVAAAFKPNSAFFEAFGPQGIAVLAQVIAAVPAAIPVILDAKRGDIASTAEAYAQAVFRTLGAGAVTVSPYLGRDSVEPFLTDPERGIFLLCKTSNPGAADLQDLVVAPAGEILYEHVALLAQSWNSRDNVGLVVGATQPEALRRVRALAPGLWILAPGVGAQGGDLRQALQAGLRADGLGVLLPVSRALSRAADPARAARELRDQINLERAAIVVARVGLQPTGELDDHYLAGPYHPALRHLADSAIALDMAASLINDYRVGPKAALRCHPGDVSIVRGQKNDNLRWLKACYLLEEISIQSHDSVPRGSLALRRDRENITIRRMDLRYEDN